MPVMIYHAPYALNRQATSASGIRPVQMRDAFEANGYDVLEVTGSPAQRRKAITHVKRELERGTRIDFLYSESATIPTMLAGEKHLPPHPWLDLRLFKMCQKFKIPTSLFYRDIYWAFDSYYDLVNPAVAWGMRLLYRYDLRWYAQYVDTLYLPSEKMAEYVPIYPCSRMAALPPGSNTMDAVSDGVKQEINVLYIGGMGEHYKLHECVKAVVATPGVSMTICTRANEWEKVRAEYEPLMDSGVRVVNKSGKELQDLYADADLCSLFVDPGEYRSFAAPVKLYEYIGYGLPVVASASTHAATFVENNDCGWAIPYEARALQQLFETLVTERHVLDGMSANVRQQRLKHTWQARAAQVAADMAQLRTAGS